jgi:hypothetical protein
MLCWKSVCPFLDFCMPLGHALSLSLSRSLSAPHEPKACTFFYHAHFGLWAKAPVPAL